MNFVLDASAVLAALLDEPGGDYAFEIMGGSEISAVNLGEVYSTLLDGGMQPAEAKEIVPKLDFRVRTFRDAHAARVGQLRPLTKSFGLSLGDRACIAQSELSGLSILTCDTRLEEAGKALGLDPPIALLR